MYLLSIRFRAGKPHQEIQAMSAASLPMFRKMPGLLEKYFVENSETGEVGGIYLWETVEQVQEYLDGPVVAAMPERFGLTEPLTYEIFEVGNELTCAATSPNEGRMIGSVCFTSILPAEDLRSMSSASIAAYKDIPGLIRVFRVAQVGTNRVGGVYVWADESALESNLSSDGVAQIPAIFKVEGTVDIERLRVNVALSD
ncbi:YdhR family protein [Rhodococcus erythropolis]|uniref:YdhR family protein n=1 Tax=Rhodococcus erythropolis TaxID=1833 RepID=UPI003D0CEF7A